MTARKTEELVRKAFCHGRDCKECPNRFCELKDYRYIARDARRFVKAEQAEKDKNKPVLFSGFADEGAWEKINRNNKQKSQREMDLKHANQ